MSTVSDVSVVTAQKLFSVSGPSDEGGWVVVRDQSHQRKKRGGIKKDNKHKCIKKKKDV